MSDEAQPEGIPAHVDLHLTPNGVDCKLLMNGVDISKRAYKVEIVAEVGEPTKVVFYAHLLDVTCLGDTWVQQIAKPWAKAQT